MADKKISQLPISTTLDGTELVPIVQGGVTVQATSQDIADLNTPTLQDLQSVTDEGRTTTHSITANAFIKTGGTSTQFLKANGTVDNSIYITIADVPNFVNLLKQRVKADENLIKGQAVYVSGANGANILVQKGDNRNEPTSSKILGLVAENLSLNDQGYVITEGVLEGLDTGSATEGDPVWLGINGELIYGLVNKPYAPEHLVFIGIVTRAHSTVGSIFVKIQNGFELREIHDVDLITTTPSDNEVLTYELSTGLWKNKTIVSALGFTPYNATNPSGYITSSALSTYVPYTGATANVNLGTYTIKVGNGTASATAIQLGATANLGLYSSSANKIDFVTQGITRMSVNADGTVVMGSASTNVIGNTFLDYATNSTGIRFTPTALNLSVTSINCLNIIGPSTTGNTTSFNLTKPNNTNQTATFSISGWNYNGGTRQWATGNIGTQSENVWGATTYSFVGASTITNAYGNVFNAPIAGTNCTITNNWAGLFNGNVVIGSTGQLIEIKQTANLPALTMTGTTGSYFNLKSGTRNLIFENYSADINFFSASGATFRIRTTDSNNIQLATNNVNRFTIGFDGNFYVNDASNFVLGTTTGNKIGTLTTQKIGFWNATPIVQPANTTSLNGVLENTGLMASGSTEVSISKQLNLMAGTTSNSALKLTAGDVLTTPVDGSIEFDGHELYFTKDGQRFLIMMVPA